jgi:hypothetical protein
MMPIRIHRARSAIATRVAGFVPLAAALPFFIEGWETAAELVRGLSRRAWKPEQDSNLRRNVRYLELQSSA